MLLFQEKHLEFTPHEIEFFAEDTEVTIVPNFNMETSGSLLLGLERAYGPFRANMRTKVPLWLAIALYRRQRCQIAPPSWMQLDMLQDAYDQEKADGTSFQPLPFHYVEIAHLLFTYAKDCFGDSLYKVRDLVDSVRKLRMSKIEKGLEMLDGPMTVKLNNLSAMECNIVRPFFQKTLDRFYQYAEVAKEARGVTLTGSSQQNSSAYGTGSTRPSGFSSQNNIRSGTSDSSAQIQPRQLRRPTYNLRGN